MGEIYSLCHQILDLKQSLIVLKVFGVCQETRYDRSYRDGSGLGPNHPKLDLVTLLLESVQRQLFNKGRVAQDASDLLKCHALLSRAGSLQPTLDRKKGNASVPQELHKLAPGVLIVDLSTLLIRNFKEQDLNHLV